MKIKAKPDSGVFRIASSSIGDLRKRRDAASERVKELRAMLTQAEHSLFWHEDAIRRWCEDTQGMLRTGILQ